MGLPPGTGSRRGPRQNGLDHPLRRILISEDALRLSQFGSYVLERDRPIEEAPTTIVTDFVLGRHITPVVVVPESSEGAVATIRHVAEGSAHIR